MTTLNLSGTFYPSFASQLKFYSDADKICVQEVVARLLDTQTSAERPGMLLGKIQSGKTKTFLAVIALGFDNGFDACVILTKGTKELRVVRDCARKTWPPLGAVGPDGVVL